MDINDLKGIIRFTSETPEPLSSEALDRSARATIRKWQEFKEYQEKLRRGEVKPLTYGDIQRQQESQN